MSPYLFILALEVVFAVIKSNQSIHQLITFEHNFLYPAYVEYTTFFIKNQADVIDILKAFGNFSKVSGLKPNKSKCEIARIGALKGVRVALYGMYCINLNKEPAKILRIQLSYTIKLEEKKNFNNHTAKIENVLKYEK